jgi:hypothetical protein
VALSTPEANYISVCLWKLLAGLFRQMLDPTVIHCDNKSCVKLSENLVSHDSSKHVKIKFHYIRDMVLRKEVLMQYLPPDEQIVDVLTKTLSKSKLEYFRDKTWNGREYPSH